MKAVDLFSGIGGLSLAGSRAGIETIQFCEIEPFCQAVLKKNFPGGYLFMPTFGHLTGSLKEK